MPEEMYRVRRKAMGRRNSDKFGAFDISKTFHRKCWKENYTSIVWSFYCREVAFHQVVEVARLPGSFDKLCLWLTVIGKENRE